MLIDVIPIVKRVCDLCNDQVTNENQSVTKSFILTDWGVICIKCWDSRILGYAEFAIVSVYVTSQRVEDEWIRRPLLFTSFSPDEPPRRGVVSNDGDES